MSGNEQRLIMQNNSSKILIVDDNEDVLIAARLLLKPYTSVTTEKNPALLPGYLNQESYDVIFLDMNFSKDTTGGEEGFFWLKEILKYDPSAIVILITAYGDVEKAVKAIKEGAIDFITKPWQNEKFLATFFSAMKLRASRLELEKLRLQQSLLRTDYDKHFQDLVGTSPAIQKVFSVIKKVAATDANIFNTWRKWNRKRAGCSCCSQTIIKKEMRFLLMLTWVLSASRFLRANYSVT